MTEPTSPSQATLPVAADKLVPHRPPMLFVDQLVTRSGDEASATAVMPENGICVEDGRILPEYFIEVVAQTMAMANGYDALAEGRPMRDGMLVGVDRFTFHGSAQAGARLDIYINKTMEFGAVKIIHGEIHSDGTLLVQGDLKVWEAVDEREKK